MTPFEFLDVAGNFQLGMLDTERPHPDTSDLSELARNDLPRAIESLKGVDRHALGILEERQDQVLPLAVAIRDTIGSGDRVYFCGCGATGRLSLSLEIFARGGLLAGAGPENVFGFMAGGDAALIRSIERFEDRPEFGERQLKDLGFGPGDLLISSTEGGETPFVIGATESAAEISRRAPFFLYCNPDEVLRPNVERSRRVIENPSIEKINLAVGPMALSGSTRMQASTVLMAAIGYAMKHAADPAGMVEDVASWRRRALDAVDWSFLEEFIVSESELYESGGYVLYEPGEFGITVLTDTAERSPTFTLTPFERVGEEKDAPSLCYLHLEGTNTPAEAWRRLLRRDPRPVEWGELSYLTGGEAMRKFDFSDGVSQWRKEKTAGAPHEVFRIDQDPDTGAIRWRFRDRRHVVGGSGEMDWLGKNLLLKMLMNVHSTLVMGRLGRYEGNLMTYVSANNYKLIDRAVRYVRILMERRFGEAPPYDVVARRLLELKPGLGSDEPIVLKTVDSLHPES